MTQLSQVARSEGFGILAAAGHDGLPTDNIDLVLILLEGAAADIHQPPEQIRSRFARPSLRREIDRVGDGWGLGDLVTRANGRYDDGAPLKGMVVHR